MKTFLCLLATTVTAAAIYSFKAPGEFFYRFLNATFFIGVVFLLTGLFLFVYEGGFFDGILHSFRIIGKKTKLGEYASQFDDGDEAIVPRSVAKKSSIFRLTCPLIKAGGLFVAADTIIAFVIYA
jgi:hypothetical protein